MACRPWKCCNEPTIDRGIDGSQSAPPFRYALLPVAISMVNNFIERWRSRCASRFCPRSPLGGSLLFGSVVVVVVEEESVTLVTHVECRPAANSDANQRCQSRYEHLATVFGRC